jgi:hypothetical protein
MNYNLKRLGSNPKSEERLKDDDDSEDESDE